MKLIGCLVAIVVAVLLKKSCITTLTISLRNPAIATHITQQKTGIHEFYTKKHKTTQAQSCRKQRTHRCFLLAASEHLLCHRAVPAP